METNDNGDNERERKVEDVGELNKQAMDEMRESGVAVDGEHRDGNRLEEIVGGNEDSVDKEVFEEGSCFGVELANLLEVL